MHSEEFKNNRIINGMGTLLVGDILWFITSYTDTLLKIDWKTKEVIAMYQIPENINVEYAHVEMCMIGRLLYIFPCYGKKMYCFDTEQQVFTEIVMPKENNSTAIEIKSVAVYENYIYCFGKSTNKILCYDTVLQRFSWCVNHIELLEKSGAKMDSFLFNTVGACKEEHLYMPIDKQCFLLHFNMKTQDIDVIKIEENIDIKVKTIANCKGDFLLTTYEGMGVLWSSENRETKVWRLNQLQGRLAEYYKVLCVNDKEYYIPSCDRKFFCKNGAMKELAFTYPQDDRLLPEQTAYEAVFTETGKIYIQLRTNGQFYCIDTKEDTVKWVRIQIPLQIEDELKKQVFHHNESVMRYEDDIYSLDAFLHNILN